MPGERLDRIHAALASARDGRESPVHLCQVATDIVGVAGAGVMVMSGDLPQGSLCTTNAVSHLIEELQYTLGEGPCVDAYQHDHVVLEPDLARPSRPRWPAFSSQALDAGVRAVFGFPLRQGAARLGAMNLYEVRPGPLRDDQHADALAMAEVIAGWVLTAQASATPGTLASSLEVASDFHWVVHNAAGMVSVQLGVSVTEAMVRLRAYAFAENRLLRDVATDVVEHRLSLS